MKNENNNFNQKDSFEEENLNIDKISQLKNSFNNDKLLQNVFDDDLNLSNIVNTNNNLDEIQEKNLNNVNNIQNISIDKSLSEDLENFNKINNENINKDQIDIHLNEKINLKLDITNNKEKKKKTRTKDDLNNTPIYIFDCFYCANEMIVFNHFINEILSDKYLLLTSNNDINDLNKLISNRRLSLKRDDKNDKLLNIIIKSTEYIKVLISQEKIMEYFKSEKFQNLCTINNLNYQKIFKQKVEDSIVRKKKDFYFKGIKQIPKNSLNNKGLFNSTNSLINNFNALSGLVEPVQQINVNNNVIIKNNYTFGTCSNNSINFNSLSLNNNEFNYYKDNNINNNNLDYIVEKIEKKEESVNYVDELIIDIFKFDLSRKISKKDIKFDNKIYDIWNPDISSDFDEEENISQINNITENKSVKVTNKSILIEKSINFNKSMGYLKYEPTNTNKNTQISFNFSNMEEKNNEVNRNKVNKITKNAKNKNKGKSINNEIKGSLVIGYKSKKKENIKTNSKNKINKSYDVNKYINNYIYLNNQKYIMPSMKKLGNSTTNISYNTNKSANILGKSFKKFYKKEIDNKNLNSTKSLKYIKYIKNDNSNSSTNYSINVNMNLKTNSLIKSNGIINCLNNKEKLIGINFDKVSSNKENIKINKSMIKKDGGINLFNSINLLNLAKKRAKSGYKKTYTKNKDSYKNKNKKNEYSINNTNKKIILRKNDLYYSSNSLVNIYNTNNNINKNTAKSIGFSFGSSDYNMSDSTTNMIFNSLSNINNSNYSPYRANKTYYYNNSSQEIKNRINDLISLVHDKGSLSNKNCHYNFSGNNMNLFKNKSINCFNSTSFLGKSKNKISKNIRPHISKY